jgi:RNA polymerase-binding transcription factor DksA
MTKKKPQPIRFPASVLVPVNNFLKEQLKTLQKQKNNLKEEDPFSNTERANDNAALDTEAEEQFGHARTLALRSELDKRIIEVRKSLTRVKVGKYGICENCGKMIDTDRLMIYPEATRCVTCEKKR